MKYNLWSKKVIDSVLSEAGFTFKKSLGQNFLTNPMICPSMAEAAADKDTGVIEIGLGVGVLTAELAEVAKRVVGIELDERLKPVLEKTLEDYNNLKLIFSDVLKLDLNKVIAENFADCKKIAVCANLPYYITSPIIMSLLESKLPIDNITVMVQKEAADRLCAKIPSREVGAVTLAAAYYAEREILFKVPRSSFTPSPNVDSAVIQFKIRSSPEISTNNEKLLFRIIRGAFEHRRKTLVNSISSAGVVPKEKLILALDELGIKPTVRAEELTLEQFARLTDILSD